MLALVAVPEEFSSALLTMPKLQPRCDKARYNNERVVWLKSLLLLQRQANAGGVVSLEYIKFGEPIREFWQVEVLAIHYRCIDWGNACLEFSWLQELYAMISLASSMQSCSA